MSISLIVGLGNPGPDYALTRHNAGFLVVDALARHWGLSWQVDKKFSCAVARHRASGGETLCWLVKPMRYMNLSGETVAPWMRYRNLEVSQTVFAYDEVQVPLGQLKISLKGSAGGHNGIADLIRHLGPEFVRLRLGIGPKTPAEIDIKDFVLGKFSLNEQQTFRQTEEIGVKALIHLHRDGPVLAMNQFNRKPNLPAPVPPAPPCPNHETGNQKNL